MPPNFYKEVKDMPNTMLQHGNEVNSATFTHVCDTVADMANIPSNQINLGTICIVLEGTSGNVEFYMAKSNKQWKKVA